MFEAASMVSAAKHFPNGSEILLAIAEEDGVFYGCFPVLWIKAGSQPSNSWSGFRRAVYTTEVARIYDGTPLIRDIQSAEASSALLRAFAVRGNSRRAGILTLYACDLDGPVSALFETAAKEQHLSMRPYRIWTRPMLRRRDSNSGDEELYGAYKKNSIKWRGQLEEQVGGPVTVVDRSSDAFAVDELISLEAAGYKAEAGTAFDTMPGYSDWLREMCTLFRNQDRVVLYSLETGGSVLAMNLSIRAGKGLFGIAGTYDERYSKFAPGIQLWREVTSRFIKEDHAEWLDSCTYAGNKTLQRILPDSRRVATYLIGVGGPVDRFLLWTAVLGNAMFGVNSNFQRRHPRLHRLIDRAYKRVVLRTKANSSQSNNDINGGSR